MNTHSTTSNEGWQDIATAPCKCIAEVNAKLAESNGELLMTFWPVTRPLLETQKLDAKKRVKPPLVVASFCPFCGQAYPKVQP